jgi:general L-amino acid transport system permease protein
MSATAVTPGSFVRRDPERPLPAPVRQQKALLRMLFGDLFSAMATVLLAALLLMLLPRLLAWAVVNGIWSGDGADCRNAGACWAFLREKGPLVLFGIYPPAERWRPILVIVMVIALTLWTLAPSHWTMRSLVAWMVTTLASIVLMAGGVFGLSAVPTSAWGGLPVTILLTVLSLGLGFPLAIVLALGRQSMLPAIRILCVLAIEIVRGLPLLSMLFIASIMLPIMLPDGMSIDIFLRAIIALTIFCAAYLAEVIRGGLQAIPKGQREAAEALGLSWLQLTRLIILPQAISKVIPPLTNTVVVTVKNTSLVLVIGLFDLLSASRTALTDPAWPAPYAETFLFVAFIYFLICFGISRYSLWLERRAAMGVR